MLWRKFISRRAYFNQSPRRNFLPNIVLIIFTRPKIIFTLFSTGSKIIQCLESQNVIFTAESHLFPSKLDTPGHYYQCPTAVQPGPSISEEVWEWVKVHKGHV